MAETQLSPQTTTRPLPSGERVYSLAGSGVSGCMSMQVVPVKSPISNILCYRKVLYTTYIELHHKELAICLSASHLRVSGGRLLSAPGELFPA